MMLILHSILKSYTIFFSFFLQKGYDYRILDTCLAEANSAEWQFLLSPKPKDVTCVPVILVSTFSPIYWSLKSIVNHSWHILSSDPSICKSFETRPRFADKRSKNLSDHLVKTNISKPQKHFLSFIPNGNFICYNCINCNAMIKTAMFTHALLSKKLKVRGRVTCTAYFCCIFTHIVYVMWERPHVSWKWELVNISVPLGIWM